MISLWSCFVLAVLSAACVDGLPYIFQYEAKKAENFVHEFEMTDMKAKPGVEQHLPTLKAFSWRDCGNASFIMSIQSLSISPDPLGLPGDLTVAAEFKVKEDLDTDLSASLVIEKKVLGKYIKIPCIDGFGSCTYDKLCNDLKQIGDQCPDPVKKLLGNDCQCPIKEASYNLPKFTTRIDASIIPSGEYQIQANVKKNGKPAACLRLYLSID